MTAFAEKRIGLVIGNDLYSDVPVLKKAGADAQAISAALGQQGFDIVTVLNANRREMNRTISTFTEQLEAGDTAFVFFAGHGVEIDGENYLLPTDILAPASGERDFIKAESIALSALLDRVRATGARMTIAIIDACRNNPFQKAAGRSIGSTRGLGRITAPQGTFVIFSAGAGQLALDELTEDDPADNSVFTRALVPRLSQPGLELRSLVADLRVEVRDLAQTVNHRQFPAYYDELLGDFYFASAKPSIAERPAPAGTSSGSDAPVRTITDPMRADFDLARAIGTADALQSFLDRYANRREEFSYRMAVQLLDRKRPPSAQPPEPRTETAPGATQSGDRRTIIRDTQLALNAAGCSAGTADGIIGARTRQAFRKWLDETAADLHEADLGTDTARRAVMVRKGRVCPPAVTAPVQPSASAAAGSATALGLAGNWRYTATCAFVIKVHGSVRFKRTGPNAFHGNLSDSLGQKANSDVYLNGRDITGTDYFPGVTVRWRGRLAADGNSYTATGSTGCSVYASRAG
ncbi:caspase family protein [Sedimentitalea nanhaiensis]|uniref:caspase family protein n=1 Tax=Sedimentitalea nanhaiensis TaxID=999627 RepID=UPI00040DEBFB|nr:caspase family protein [Sedimentitalea nanhaiensis]